MGLFALQSRYLVLNAPKGVVAGVMNTGHPQPQPQPSGPFPTPAKFAKAGTDFPGMVVVRSARDNLIH